jgi:Tol biopolymer transport system component
MPLTPGTRLGPYEIVAPLGAGGMGEVYRARDTRLDRDVAVKVLPQHLSSNTDVRARFEREARAVSSLNHPHICTLFDVGRDGETDYLVMELIEGESLADRLRKGALPTADALRIGEQIAAALERAHRAGVVHRDLKPGNIMLAKSGAKLMDFGLARATPGAGGISSASPLTQSPTVAAPLTAEGAIVGTVQYMAPEQLQGSEADARSDLWALGCVLHEMVSGQPAFAGANPASLIASILKETPRPLAELVPLAPPALDRVVRQCLAKDPDERWQTASDLRRELAWIAEQGSSASLRAQSGQVAGIAPRGSRERMAWTLAAVAAVIAAGALAMLAFSASHVALEPTITEVTYRPSAIFRAAYGPDGKTIVYSAATEGNEPRLYVLRPETPQPQAFGEPGTHLLSVSSQGELAVLTGAQWTGHRLFQGTLARMPLGGGTPREVLEKVRDATWAPDGAQLAIIRDVAGKDHLEYPIGHLLCESDGYMSDLRFSPGGDKIAFFDHPTRFDDRGSLNVVDLKAKKTMLSDGYWGEEGIAWARDGKEVIFSGSKSGSGWTIYAITLQGKRRVAMQSAGGQTIHDVSASGQWLTSRDHQSWGVFARTPANAEDTDNSWLDESLYPFLSQDAKVIAFTEQGRVGGNNYVSCLRKLDGSDVVRLGEGLTWDVSADGKKVVSMVSSPPQIVVYPTGAGEPLRLERGGIENYGVDGHFMAGADSVFFYANEPGRAPRYFVQGVAGGMPRAVTPEGTSNGMISPDHHFVLAKSAEGRFMVYPLAGGEPRAVPGLGAADHLCGISADGRAVFAQVMGPVPASVDRIDLTTGKRQPFKSIAPPDRVGLLGVFVTSITDDERSYAYWTWSLRSTLYTVDWEKPR